MSMRALSLSISVAISVACWPGCVQPTEIIFDITTDQPCAMLGSTAISVGTLGPTLDTKSATSVSTMCDDTTHSLGRLVVVPSGAPGELGVRVVVGVGKSGERCIADNLKGGCIVARRALNFVTRTATKVSIALERSCLDIPCAASETCVRGQCVDARTCATPGCGGGDGGTQPTTKWKKTSPSPLTPRSQVLYAAFGRKVFVWGGYVGGGYANDGAIYDASNDTWTKINPAGAPSARGNGSTVATPSGDIYLYGGSYSGPIPDGAVYHVPANNWTPIPQGPLAPRDNASVVWSEATSELLVWGGGPALGPAFNDGARWSIQSGWGPMANSPLTRREAAATLWTGKELFVYGGFDENNAATSDHAFYTPSPEGWGTVKDLGPAIEGRAYAFAGKWKDKIVVWGGDTNGAPQGGDGFGEGFVLDGTGNVVDTIPPPPIANPLRNAPDAIVIGDTLWMWGGVSDVTLTNNGAVYDLVKKTWTALEAAPLEPRDSFAYVWTGTEVVVWGGFSQTATYFADGAVYTP